MPEPTTISDKSRITMALAAAAGAALVSLTFWSATLAAHVAEHEKTLSEHAASIAKLQQSQDEMMKAVNGALAGIATDQAVIKERIQSQGETLARLDGRMTPSVIQAPVQVQAPQRPRSR